MMRLKGCLIGLGVLAVIVIGGVVVLFISNRNLPTRSRVVERLTEVEKARLAEALHLQRTLGDEVWARWGAAPIPVIVHNETYAFLVGYPDEPPAGWTMMPSGEQRGGPWEVVPEDTFFGEPYYRQRLAGPSKTPENFTVKVGDIWAATIQTKEYAAIAFYTGFRKDLPGVIAEVFPYRIMWRTLIDSSETYVGALAHEMFHAFQGTELPDRLAAAERVAPLEDRYPWDNEALEAAWQRELSYLHQAAKADSDAEAAEAARQFLAQRAARRQMAGMDASFAEYERQREWLEGMAKYAELSIALQAGQTDYTPVSAIADDPEFKDYRTRERFYGRQLDEVKRMGNRGGETRFYYGGMAQGVVLDRLMPGWKARLWQEDVALEDLLAEAVE